MRGRTRPIVVLVALAALFALAGSHLAAAAPAGKATAAKAKKRKPKGPSLVPLDYTKLKGLSQPIYTDVVTETMKLPMADGVGIYLEITRPKDPGHYGVLLDASPYHGTLYPRDAGRILPIPKGKDGNPLGMKGYFVPRGYAYVSMDMRGTGRSQGCLDHLGPNDRSDLKTVIEWAAKQPWSNGRVGVTGHSYSGGTTNLAGASGAQGLATIVPSASLARMYDHQFQDGVPFNLQWLGPIAAYEALSIDRFLPPGLPQDPVGIVIAGQTGDNFGNDPQDIGCGEKNSAIVGGTGEFTGQETDWHKARDWSQDVRKVNVPIFAVHGVNDEAARIGGLFWFTQRGRDGGHPNDKLWIGQWDHGIGCCPNQRGLQWTYALHAWFDKWVLGRNVQTGPPVEAFLNDQPTTTDAIPARKEIATAASWPPASVPTVLATGVSGSTGTLALGAKAAGEPGSLTYAADPRGYNANRRDYGPKSTGGVEFVSEPVKGDVTMIGEPTIELAVSVTQPQVDLIVNLIDENKDGDRRRITTCAENIALRDGIQTLSPAVPLQQYTVKPPCFMMAHHLLAGHKLVLRVTSSDPDKVPFHAFDPQVSIFGGPSATKMTLPVIPKPTFYRDTAPLGQRADPGAGA